MATSLKSFLFLLVSAALLAGCAGTPYSPTSFTPATIDTSAYSAKVDGFVVIMDASSSMNFKYEDRDNFYNAKDVVTHLNQTIPELGYQSALVGFGTGSCVNGEDARVVYGPATHSRADFANGLAVLECAGGVTPMADGVSAGGGLVKGTGKVALIIVSDFWQIDSDAVIATVDVLKGEYGDRLCVHTIQVGDAETGSDLTSALAGVNSCGSAVRSGSLASSADMSNYVTDVLLAPASVVRYEKNTMSASALFGHDKSNLKEEGKAALHALGDSIKAKGASVVDIDIIGHTDSDGTEAYNMALSIRRAKAVRDYIVGEGVDASIIDVSGEGELHPIASNATKEGRAENRRVDVHVGIKQPAN